MLLKDLRFINENELVNISIHGEKIRAVETSNLHHSAESFQIQFDGATAIPGLINSHDHLDFNCFPVFGERKYNNYTEWGKYIHETFKENIQTVLDIPENLRAIWGMYKNLLAGVTTVVNHGSFLKIETPLINIYQETQNIHSVQFENNWKWKLNNPIYKNKVCVVHTGEGTDKRSFDEINKLIKYNLLKRDLVGVHAVAMDAAQAKNFKGLVWCPESNSVLLNKHVNIKQLKTHTTFVFGTDSTLTGSWNIWEHLRLAKSLHQVADAELFNMVTRSPAKLWNMNNGSLQPKKDADIVVLRRRNESSTWDEFFKTDPEDILLVIQKGHIRLFDKSLLPQFLNLPINHLSYSQISIQGKIKFVEGDLPALVTDIRGYNRNIILPLDIYESN